MTVAAGEAAAAVNGGDDVVQRYSMKLTNDSSSDSVDCDCGLTVDGN